MKISNVQNNFICDPIGEIIFEYIEQREILTDEMINKLQDYVRTLDNLHSKLQSEIFNMRSRGYEKEVNHQLTFTDSFSV